MPLTATLFEARLELSLAVRASDRTHDARTSLFLRIADGDAEGWAECATAMQPGADATADEVAHALDERVLSAAFRRRHGHGDELPASSSVVAMVAHRAADVAAASLVEGALCDLDLRRRGESLREALDVTEDSIGFAGVIGISDPAAARDRAAALVSLGASRLRVKVSPLDGVAAIVAVLDEVHVPVVADANGSFVPGEHDGALDEILALPLAWLEQPYAAADLAAHAMLAARAPMSIGLDESVRSVRNVRDIARYEAASIVCCKPGRLGGIARTREVCRAASRHGLRCYLGGYFEAGLGRAVLGVLAATLDDAIDSDVVAPSTYLAHDPCGLEGPTKGRQPLFAGVGCGPVPAGAALSVRLERAV